MNDLPKFIQFGKEYIFKRIMNAARLVERTKDIIVALLVVKRGKYSSSFLNTSFFILVITVLVAGPAIAENNPFSNANQQDKVFESESLTFDPFENSVTTVVSSKPRDKVVDYTVEGGDTLSSISEKFSVSIDTIKWANNLKNDTIKPGDTLHVPPITGVVHEVVSGDNIYSIAKQYNVDPQNIVNFPFNDFADPDTFQLTPGQTLYIPDGTIKKKEDLQPAPRFVAQIQAGVKGTSNFIWPTSGTITTYPVWYHMALDIANHAAPPILASDTGTVTFAGCYNWGYGCHIIINHANGYETLYGHLSAIEVSPGQAVNQGQRIGVMGSTGRSTGTHLHFEIRSGGVQLNPLNFLQ
ncbi:peptidoglycan DD-metalloendopeptidase family protein [Candidatus Woesebacteria bacterium]|nr:peptidoglycan DD-metalloendopeptidase family protein [Candidatus Woesebacteria bacterium]